MAVFFKAILGEIALVVDKYSKMTMPTTMEDKTLHRLERLSLRVQVIVEEAEGRHITNQAMIHRLNLLRKEMYKGYFTLDTLKSQGFEARGHNASHSFALSKFNPAKRIFFSTTDTHREQGLQQVIDNLNNMIYDANELIMFLKDSKLMYKKPYDMHLFIGNCMFGRQMEIERIINFLMLKDHLLPEIECVDVLPIVGAEAVGKSTLVAHVSNDARVQSYFSQILVITGEDINTHVNLATLKERGVVMHQNNSSGENERCLVIIEFSRDIDEVAWNSFYSYCGAQLGKGSKVIITSRSNEVIKFGTTHALMLNSLPLEAYWYFFKILSFGSTHSGDHPELELIAMQMARGLNGSFIAANVVSSFLQTNLTHQFWLMYLENIRKNKEINVSGFSADPINLFRNNKPATCLTHCDDMILVWDNYRTCSSEENVTTLPIKDVIFGVVKCEGEFEVLVWKSNIQPYNSIFASCRIKKPQ